MIDQASSGPISLALVNAALLALWPVLPGLLLGYLKQSAALRRAQAEFSLRPSEKHELDRARQLYRDVRGRLMTIERADPGPGSWRSLFSGKKQIGPDEIETFEDLKAHADVLRETIFRLQRRPLKRLKSWMRLVSSRAALSRALAAHIAGFVLLLVVFRIPNEPAWAGDLTTDAPALLAWYPFDGRFFYANAVAAGFAAGAALVFYALQWATLRRDYGCEFCSFAELARSDPDCANEPADANQTSATDQASAGIEECTETESDWCSVLGLPPAATTDDIKAAYKRLIKQSHPESRARPVAGISTACGSGNTEAQCGAVAGALRRAAVASKSRSAGLSRLPVRRGGAWQSFVDGRDRPLDRRP